MKSNNYSTDKKHSKLTSNLATRLAHNTLGKEKSKYSRQYFTVSILLVVKSFMKNLLMTKSSDCKSDLVRPKGHASRPYKSTGKHLLSINCRVTSSEATRPILANTAFAVRQNAFLACSSEHLNLRECTINIPRYLVAFTHEMTVPAERNTGRHEALFLHSIRKQHDSLVLTDILSLSSSNSHVLTKASRPHSTLQTSTQFRCYWHSIELD